MPIAQKNLINLVFDQLKSLGYNPVPKTAGDERVPIGSNDIAVIEFTFIKDGVDYGTAHAAIIEGSLVLYFNDSVADSPKSADSGKDISWTDFIKLMKRFSKNVLRLKFKTDNQSNLKYDMAKRRSEKLDEGYYPVNKTTSYSDNIPTVKIIIKHSKNILEGEQRYRHISKIFIENTDGERILAPTNKPGIARVYARLIAEGDKPYSEKWNHISTIVEEYTKMAGFVRATKNKQFNESTVKLVNEGMQHYQRLRETLHKLTNKRGYHTYFENWTPSLMETEETNNNLSSLFLPNQIDPRIESALPILSRLNKNIKEDKVVLEFEQMVDNLSEQEIVPTSSAQIQDFIDLFKREKLPVGADAQNITNLLKSVNFENDELFDELSKLANKDSNSDSKTVIVNWMIRQEDSKFDKILEKLYKEIVTNKSEFETEPELEPPMPKVEPTLPPMPKVEPTLPPPNPKVASEDLDKNQKSVNQLGPDEVMKTISPILGKELKKHPADGKLVGEHKDDVLSRIKKLSGLL